MTKTVPKNNHCTKKPFYQRILSMIAALALIAAIFPVSFSASAASNEETIYNYLTGTMHLNQAAASGALANIYKESSFNPNATGDGRTSYGICQWHNERWTSLKNYCNNNGYDWTTLNGQLHYLDYELKNYYPGVYSTLTSVANTADGAYNAGYKWCYSYEIPDNKEAVSVERGNLAKNTYWPKYSTANAATTSEVVSMLNSWKSKLNGKYWNYYDRNAWDSRRSEVEAKLKAVVDNGYLNSANPTNAQLGVTNTACTGSYYPNGCISNYFSGGWQCFGFAWFIEYALFHSTYQFNENDWYVYSGSGLNGISLQPGDLVRVNNHSATIHTVSGDSFTAVECYGGSGCIINWSNGFYHNTTGIKSVSGLLNECKSNGGTVYRYKYISSGGYTLTLNPGAGSCSTPTVSVPQNGVVPALPTAALDGYTFAGWYTALFGGTQVTASSTINASQTLYAHWTKNGTKISFDPAGGVLGGVSNSYMLDGINTGRGVGKLIVYTTPNTVVNTNEYGCEVAVDSYGHVTQYRPYGSQTQLTVPWGGFVLSGQSAWDEGTQTSYGGGPFVGSIGALSDPYVRIDYETGEVRAYNGHAAYMANEKYVSSSGQYGVLPVPTKTGYYFDGWYTGTNGTRVTYGTTYTSDSLTAKWTQSPIPAASVSYNGHWYEVYDSNMTWKEAKALCESIGGYLACITTAGEQSAVLNLALAGKMNLYYIGATDEAVEGTWRWVSGETFQYNNWDPHLPEPSSLSGENYSSMMTVDSPPNKHVGEWIDCYNMTCGGIYDYSNCGFICEYNVPNACSHTYTYSVTTAPTTSAAGVLTGTCPKCGDVTTITLPKLNTADYNYTVTKEPTCTATGTGRYTWKTTTYGTYYFEVTLPKKAHNYQTIVTPPTCTAQGYTTHTCSACGDTYKDNYTAALGHNYSYTVTTAPTVTAPGVLTGTCSRCNVQTSVALPKLTTTDYTYTVTKAATCTATGTGRYTWKTTTYGTFYFDVTIPKTAHNYQTAVTPPTCTAQGYTTHTCSVCGDSYKDSYTDALGHAWDNGVVTKPATETEPGIKLYTCTRCGATRTETIPVIGHVHNYTETVVAPTCTAQGYTLHTCSCGDSYKDSYTAALGHSFGAWTTVTSATCTASGTETRTCTRCGQQESRAIPALGHAESDWIIDRNPSCTASGYKHTECTRCGVTVNTAIIAAVGHKESGWITDKAATCTASGTRHTECTVCGATIQTGVISALGHAWDAGVITKPATETETGVKTFTCTRCGETKTELIPKLDGKVNPFVDVAKGKYYYDAVLWAYYHEPYQVTGGTDATHFSPNKTCTREQVVSFLYAANGKPEHHMTTNPFTDVKAKKYYYNAVMWAVENEITGGVTETTFGVGKACTREQVVTFLWKAAGAPAPKSTSTPFTDVKAGKYYYNAVLWAVENGITGGTSATTFGVGKPCTRAQVVTFLYAAMGKAE